MSQHPRRPRPLNLRPARLDARLRDYARSIEASRQRPIGNRQAEADTAPRLDWFTIVEEFADYVECTRRDDGSVTYRVAKPPDLQGAIAEREFSGETHEITPPYEAEGLLWGFSIPGGGGQAFDAGNDTVPYEWQDLNRDARQWARVPT